MEQQQSFVVRMLTTRNVAWWDRILRALPAPVVFWAYTIGAISTEAAVGLGILAGMLLLTSFLGSCSIYYMLGFSTCPISGKPRPDY